MEVSGSPFKVGERVDTKIVVGRLAGRWIPARVIRVHHQWRTLDLCVLNNRAYQVAKYAIQVPMAAVRRPTYRFNVGDHVATKILRGRKEGIWIPAKVIRVNEDCTYDLFVEEHKAWQVTKYAVHVPGQFLKPAPKAQGGTTQKGTRKSKKKRKKDGLDLSPALVAAEPPVPGMYYNQHSFSSPNLPRVALPTPVASPKTDPRSPRESPRKKPRLKASPAQPPKSKRSGSAQTFSAKVSSLFGSLWGRGERPTQLEPTAPGKDTTRGVQDQHRVPLQDALKPENARQPAQSPLTPQSRRSPRATLEQRSPIPPRVNVMAQSPHTPYSRKGGDDFKDGIRRQTSRSLTSRSNWENMYEWSEDGIPDRASESGDTDDEAAVSDTDWGDGGTSRRASPRKRLKDGPRAPSLRPKRSPRLDDHDLGTFSPLSAGSPKPDRPIDDPKTRSLHNSGETNHSDASNTLTSPPRSEKGESPKPARTTNDNREDAQPNWNRARNMDTNAVTFVDSFLPKSKRKKIGKKNSEQRIVTIGVSKHRVRFNELDMDTPLEDIAKWLAEDAKKRGIKNHHPAVHSFCFNNQRINLSGNALSQARHGSATSLSTKLLKEHGRMYSLADVLGKSVDASTQGLAFFVGPVDGQMSYKMSVCDVDAIHRMSRTESAPPRSGLGNLSLDSPRGQEHLDPVKKATSPSE